MCPAAARAQATSVDSRSARLDSLFAAYATKSSPGCAVGLSKDGVVLLERGYGMASLEQSTPITPATIFDIGSVSKQFTAMLVQLLAREGRLSLDDDVRRWVPELPSYGPVIRLRHLLHQTSGLRDYVELFPLAGVQYETVVGTSDVLAMLRRQRRVNFRPGDEWLYSNTNYFLLSLVVERASGRPMSEVLRERIFGPLGMTSSQLWTRHTQVVPGRASSYAPSAGGGFEGVVYDWETTGDGAIQSTVGDLLRWLDNFERPRVGDSALVARLLTPGTLNDGTRVIYAQGMIASEHHGARRQWHNGAGWGFRSQVERYPDQRLTIALLCNTAAVTPSTLGARVADVYLDAPAPAAPASPAAGGAPATSSAQARDGAGAPLDAYAGLYMSEQSGLTRRVRAEKGALHISAGGPDLPLEAAGGAEFQVSGRPVRIRFDVGPRHPPRLHEISGNGTVRYERVADTTKLSPVELSAYTGDYESDELGAAWRVRPANGRLVLRIRGVGAVDDTLQATFKDGFGSSIAALRFERAPGGRVTGLRVWTRAVRGVLLTRHRARTSRRDI